MKKKTKAGKLASIFSGASGGGAIAGAHSVCHMLCQAVVALAAIFGIAVSSTALMFLEDYAIYMWSMGLAFMAIGMLIHVSMRHGSPKLLAANTGVLVIGVPFLQNYNYVIWPAGAAILAYSVLWHLAGTKRIWDVFG